MQCNPILDLGLGGDGIHEKTRGDVTTCSERAKKYGKKWIEKDATQIESEMERLEKLMMDSESSSTAELRRWMRERRDILKIIHKTMLEGWLVKDIKENEEERKEKKLDEL